jgi:hypothetical protein
MCRKLVGRIVCVIRVCKFIEIVRSLFWTWRSRNWIPSDARIVLEKESLLVNPSFAGGGPIQGGVGRVHKIRYEYTVDGQVFLGWRVTRYDMWGFSDLRHFPEIRRLLNGEEESKSITILHSEANPRLSLISRRISLAFLLAYGGAVVLGLFLFWIPLALGR